MTITKITIEDSKKIAKSVLNLLHRVDPRTINIEDQIDAHLANVGLGWKLKPNTYIDGLGCNSIKILAHEIRNSAIELF